MTIDVKEVFRDLPVEPLAAIGIVFERLDGYLRKDDSDSEYRAAVNLIRRFIEAAELKISVELGVNTPWKDDYYEIKNNYHALIVENYVGRIESESIDEIRQWKESSDTEEFGFARFSNDEREKVFSHIEKIRVLITSSGLSEKKKAKLLDRLGDLHDEAMQEKTRTERFFAFMGDMAFVVGDMAEKAKPAISEVKDILRIVMGSRARNEGVVLPAPDDLPQLPTS
ncbi:hypothetical protein [Hansschlegelia sp.]|uniref:hypothetical protein n=1 Tax=Hansschlegelia sp. TaxID=2041892 RepID=UPI002C7721BF|nr:hypothetical protein [Hansschlegelia sp.]HVI29073.1 hypothetical protein [Hansschlegelia sp.]